MSNSIKEDFKGTERFIIQRRLGAGGFGEVYQVYDRERTNIVALKLLNQVDADNLYRFKREFRALADLAHPNLVTLYELISEGDLWFFTMELVDGVNFLEYISQGAESNSADNTVKLKTQLKLDIETHKEKRPLVSTSEVPRPENISLAIEQDDSLPASKSNFDRLRLALRQLAEGVQALHESGKLHRDLKPSNVLVTDDERVVILDFGLVTELAANGIKQSLEIIGTPAYMSPEQGAGLPISAASDWYSVGVMLYEALTDQLPFDGSLGNVLMEKLTSEPPPPSELAANIPADLDALCQQLLRRDPKKRPEGKTILQSLACLPAEKRKFRSGASPVLRNAPFIGREEHMAILKTALESVKQGRAAMVNIHGHSGMGKSALIRHFLDELRENERSALALEGRCYEQESMPYKAFDSIIDALSYYLQGLSNLQAKAFLPFDVLALARLFPVLKQVEAIAGAKRNAPDIPDPQELRRRAFAALRELLARIAEDKLLVIYIDDLQWGDIDSAGLLGELLRPPDPPALLLINSYRSEEIDKSPLLRSLKSHQADIDASLAIYEVAVKELLPGDARRLAKTLCAQDQQEDLSDFIEPIARESGGNPFFIYELVKYYQNGLAAVNGAAARPTTPSLSEAIRARVAQLSEDERCLLELLAVAGQPIERATAKRAASLGADEQALAFLRASNLIKITKISNYEEIETYHDRIRETIAANLDAETLKAHHKLLAQALEAAGQIDAERLAIHYQGAGELKKAAKFAEIAADRAGEALAFDRAARLYKLALQLASLEADKAHALNVKLADALNNAGRGSEAAQVYLACAEKASIKESLELQRHAAEQFLISGHIDEGLSVLRAALRSIGMKMAETPRGALLSFLLRRLQIRLRGLNFHERKESEIAPVDLWRVDICYSAAMGLAAVDTIRGADFQARQLLLALKAGEPFRIIRALAMEVGYSSVSGSRAAKRTNKLLAITQSLVERSDDAFISSIVTFTTGLAAFLNGNWKNAHEKLEAAIIILRERSTGVTWQLDSANIFSLRSLLYLGELNRLCERLPATIKEARERGDLYAVTGLGTALSYVPWLVADNVENARKEMWEAIEQWTHEGFHLQHYWTLLGQTQIELYAGESKKAFKIINAQWPELKRGFLLAVQNSLIEMLQLRARCALALMENNVAEINSKQLLAGVERDAKKIAREQVPSGIAFANLLLAAVAAGRKRWTQAIELLDLAETGFEATNMALYKAAARRRRGQLIGAEAGKLLIADADSWMAGQNIKNPARMTAMLAPGKWLD